MTKMITYLQKLLGFVLVMAATASNGYAQTVPVDSIDILEAPSADSDWSEEDYEEEESFKESFEDSSRRAVANAFDTLGSNAPTSIGTRYLDKNYVQRLKNNASFFYVKNGIPKPVEKKFESPKFHVNELTFYIAIGVFALFLIWYLWNNSLLVFRKKSVGDKVSTVEDETDTDIFSINFKDAVDAAVQAGNYRLAIRLQYLQLLKTLSEKGIIKYQTDKTNYDYLLQTRSSQHYNEFFTATRNFEYSWYGLFPIDAARYAQIGSALSNLQQKLNRP